MSISENSGVGMSGSALAALTEAYAATFVDPVAGSSPALDEAVIEEAQAPTGAPAGQPEAVVVAPTDAAPASAVTPEPEISEKVTPFRVFANEDEYRSDQQEASKRERAAQAALAVKNRELEDRLNASEQERTALERWRNEIYARGQSEELTPQVLVESYVRRENESKAEFAAREAERERLSAAAADREAVQQLNTKASTVAAEAAYLRRALDLSKEIGPVAGLDVAAALRQAVETEPTAVRMSQLSHEPGASQETRAWAAEQAYQIAGAAVKSQAAALVAALTPPPEAVLPPAATSIQSTTIGGSDLPTFKNPVDALSFAYSQPSGRR